MSDLDLETFDVGSICDRCPHPLACHVLDLESGIWVSCEDPKCDCEYGVDFPRGPEVAELNPEAAEALGELPEQGD